MKHIEKNSEPNSFTTYKMQSNAKYDDIPSNVKKELKESLLVEQGNICGYCMQRISYGNMKVEHIDSQKNKSSRQLDYNNIIGVCKGNEGNVYKNQHCDSFKRKESLFFINPVDKIKNCEGMIKYLGDGTIISHNQNINNEINKLLNLNIQTLKNNRKKVYDGAIEILTKKNNKQWSKSIIQSEIKKWSLKDKNNRYKEYCMVVVYFLKKKINNLK